MGEALEQSLVAAVVMMGRDCEDDVAMSTVVFTIVLTQVRELDKVLI